ncbi:hypothetical protein Slin15195_G129930 [Septoria linicola]|uniref:Uncharacterized protein n=1 Tax=Septoria linicola TaxID=215465 RepID=A0A9Q9B2D2_9PEZI|nr:hypothetical protein Slin14017_G128950 [Septoria linicola]USW59674.1 hypothetical protein Slin15195_G129930 [Septoria linicola]
MAPDSGSFIIGMATGWLVTPRSNSTTPLLASTVVINRYGPSVLACVTGAVVLVAVTVMATVLAMSPTARYAVAAHFATAGSKTCRILSKCRIWLTTQAVNIGQAFHNFRHSLVARGSRFVNRLRAGGASLVEDVKEIMKADKDSDQKADKDSDQELTDLKKGKEHPKTMGQLKGHRGSWVFVGS